jgi:hypothetical protein
MVCGSPVYRSMQSEQSGDAGSAYCIPPFIILNWNNSSCISTAITGAFGAVAAQDQLPEISPQTAEEFIESPVFHYHEETGVEINYRTGIISLLTDTVDKE